ncbi:hypothetical protein GA0115253_1004540 [Streptomyces sp. Termitarium-T10T-6]|nr:hypothetical protein [Streptomyces sp. Termitarium-T10T-6]SCD43398.1 hypothetical protein GA0115253_1004540 [Streptomyces sp. Termitarium-T10T-6]
MADSQKADLWKAIKHPRMRPWLTVAAEVPATFASHHYWGNSVPAAIGLTVAAGVLTAATWWAGEGTRPGRRIHATLSTGLGTSYLVVGTAVGPFDPALTSTLVIGGAVAAGSWNIRQALRVNVDPQKDSGNAETGVLVKAIGDAKVALRGKPKIEPNKVTAPSSCPPGRSHPTTSATASSTSPANSASPRPASASSPTPKTQPAPPSSSSPRTNSSSPPPGPAHPLRAAASPTPSSSASTKTARKPGCGSPPARDGTPPTSSPQA